MNFSNFNCHETPRMLSHHYQTEVILYSNSFAKNLCFKNTQNKTKLIHINEKYLIAFVLHYKAITLIKQFMLSTIVQSKFNKILSV